jgi:hypothetical protein
MRINPIIVKQLHHERNVVFFSTLAKSLESSLMGGRNRQKDICYICCEPGCDDKDHVIPSSFFTKPKPANLLTFPAHHQCHSEMDEEYFRVLAAGQGLKVSNAATDLWRGKIFRSVGRNMPLRELIRSSILNNVPLISKGGIYIGSTPAIKFDRNRIDPTIKKIVKGLYFHETGKLLCTNTEFKWEVVNEEPTGPMRQVLEGSKIGLCYTYVFESAFAIVEGAGLEITAWWLLFYKGLLIVCFTKRAKDLSH